MATSLSESSVGKRKSSIARVRFIKGNGKMIVNNFEPIRWRWSHSLHHSYTASVDPHDFEVDESIFSKYSLFTFLIRFVPGYYFLILHKSLH